MVLKLLILYQKCGIFGYIRLYLLLFYCYFIVILLFHIIKKCTFAVLKYLILLAWDVMFRAVIT